jgi:hypothetical protein
MARRSRIGLNLAYHAPDSSQAETALERAKVFWFFFSKKNCFLNFLHLAKHPGEVPPADGIPRLTMPRRAAIQPHDRIPWL